MTSSGNQIFFFLGGGGIRPWIDLLFIYLRVAVRADQIAEKVT